MEVVLELPLGETTIASCGLDLTPTSLLMLGSDGLPVGAAKNVVGGVNYSFMRLNLF